MVEKNPTMPGQSVPEIQPHTAAAAALMPPQAQFQASWNQVVLVAIKMITPTSSRIPATIQVIGLAQSAAFQSHCAAVATPLTAVKAASVAAHALVARLTATMTTAAAPRISTSGFSQAALLWAHLPIAIRLGTRSPAI